MQSAREEVRLEATCARTSWLGGCARVLVVLGALAACTAEVAPDPDRDTDGDALPDAWETGPVDLDGDGLVDLDLHALGADPGRKDVFVEVDWMEGADGHSDRFDQAALERVQAAFLAAPVENPSGQTGVVLHVDAGPDSLMDPVSGARWGALSEAGPLAHERELDLLRHGVLQQQHLTWARARAFRYAIAAHAVAPLPMPFCEGEDWIVNGQADGTQMIITLSVTSGLLVELGGYRPDARDEQQQASLFMHELGHTLGLRHGGIDEVNRKPNYLSVMNYSFSYRGLLIDGTYGHLDYARHGGHVLDEAELREGDGLSALLADATAEDDATLGTLFYCGDVGLVCAAQVPGQGQRIREVMDVRSPIDWNCNDHIEGDAVSAEINFEGARQRLWTRADWPYLDYSAGGRLGAARALERPAAPSPTCSPGAFADDHPLSHAETLLPTAGTPDTNR